MERSSIISLSSLRSLSSVVLAMILTSLSLTPVASQNRSSILNGVTDATQRTELYIVGCSFIFDSHRIDEPVKTVLKPGDEKNITIDDYPGVKQVECDITRYAPALGYVYWMKVVVWFFDGPSVTRCRFENNDMHFALLPDLSNFNQPTSMVCKYLDHLFWRPSVFLAVSFRLGSRCGRFFFNTLT